MLREISSRENLYPSFSPGAPIGLAVFAKVARVLIGDFDS
jgi:hypothetical protein